LDLNPHQNDQSDTDQHVEVLDPRLLNF
jgi:hypothetical protein